MIDVELGVEADHAPIAVVEGIIGLAAFLGQTTLAGVTGGPIDHRVERGVIMLLALLGQAEEILPSKSESVRFRLVAGRRIESSKLEAADALDRIQLGLERGLQFT